MSDTGETNTEGRNSDNILYLSQDWKNGAGPKPVIFDFTEDFIIFLILLPVFLLPLRIMDSTAAAYSATAIVPVDFFLLTVNRCKAKKIIYFILFLLLITTVAVTLPLLCGNYAAAITAFFASPVSCKKLKSTVEQLEKNFDRNSHFTKALYLNSNIIYVGVLTCLIAYFAGISVGYKDIAVFSFADYAAIFAAMLIYRHNSGAYCLSQWNKAARAWGSAGYGESGHKITGTLFSVWTVAAVGILALFVFFLAGISGISRVDYAIINFFKRIHEKPLASASIEQQTIADSADMKEILDKYGSVKPSLFTEVLGKVLQIFFFLIAAAAAVFAVAVISRAVIRYCRKFGENINEENRSLLSVNDTVIKLKVQMQHISHNLNNFAHGGSRMRIRRLFYNHIRRHRTGIIVKKSDSPFEIVGKVLRQSGKDMSVAAKIYEKARYSNDECNENDVRRMKDALK